MTPLGEKRVLLTRQTIQIKENEMILPRKKKRKKETRKNSQIEEEKKRRYDIIINCPAVKMTLFAWFDHLEGSFF